MKIAFILATLIFSSMASAQYIPMFTLECTSTAQFLNRNYELIGTDVKSAVAGFENEGAIGMREFKHTFRGKFYHAYVQAGISGFTYEDDSIRYASVNYMLLENDTLGAGTLRESSFYSQNEELPGKFLMMLNDIALDGIIVRLKMKCSKSI